MNNAALSAGLEGIGVHDHLCSIYETAEERHAVALPFVRIGLERGEKCIYITEEGTHDWVRRALAAEGVDVERAEARGALVLSRNEEAYLGRRPFDPQWVLGYWRGAAKEAAEQGFSAVRATGDTDWMTEGAAGLERWMEYESLLTEVLLECNCFALCQYSRKLHPPELILAVIRTHPIVVYGGSLCRNPYHVPPAEFLRPNHAEREVERLLANMREGGAMARLHELSMRLHSKSDFQEVLAEALDATIALQNADFGTIQLYDPETGILEVAAQRGLGRKFLDHFARVEMGSAACGAALQRRARVLVDDVHSDPIMAAHRAVADEEGYRAVQSTPVFGGNGEPLGVISTQFRKPHRPSEHELRLTDLYARHAAQTIERRLSEQALRRSEAHLNEGQRIGQVGSWVVNTTTGAMYGSRELWRIFGFDPESTQGGAETRRLAYERVHPEDRERVRWEFERALREPSVLDQEYRLALPDGTLKHVHCKARPVPNDRGEIEFIGTLQDVTDRRHAEEALRRSEAYLAQGQRINQTGSWAWHPASGVLYWSEEHYRILGLERAQQKPDAEAFFSLVHPEDRPAMRAAFEEATAERKVYEWDYRIVRPDGRVRYIHALAHPALACSGELVEYVGVIVDVTDRERADHELRRAREELAHVSRTLVLGELAASIAHEVNQPLAALATDAAAGLRWLGAATPNIAEACESLRRINRDANRASEVIARIRAFLARSTPQKTNLRIDEVAREAAALVQGEAQAKGAALVLAPAPELPPVVADRIQLQQVIVNLALNALEAMASANAQPRVVEIGVERQGRDELVVSVKDTGPGLHLRHAEKVFDAFFTTKPGGLGMGLAISRSIVEAHGGKLWATRNPGAGATFHFTLPLESLQTKVQ